MNCLVCGSPNAVQEWFHENVCLECIHWVSLFLQTMYKNSKYYNAN